jgi:hypothetical protein
MTHKIAIITSRNVYERYGDDYSTIINSITDWTEISDEDFNLLQKASTQQYEYAVLEQPVDTPAFVAKTIADYLVIARAEEARRAAEKKKRDAKALENKHKKELKDRESKLALLQKLQAELGQ